MAAGKFLVVLLAGAGVAGALFAGLNSRAMRPYHDAVMQRDLAAPLPVTNGLGSDNAVPADNGWTSDTAAGPQGPGWQGEGAYWRQGPSGQSLPYDYAPADGGYAREDTMPRDGDLAPDEGYGPQDRGDAYADDDARRDGQQDAWSGRQDDAMAAADDAERAAQDVRAAEGATMSENGRRQDGRPRGT
ncbi:hypothetical protein [Novosphingobium sp. Leaf2]|uniref:hypothetical protein n=1 Tax=Novosphingobium sp. Leaf2 TaxID=1735670 RepID=UPI0006FD0AAF|nr:hypothetical protein [Novosphingobium sp. Leaf2]KQM21330.1 hypothetical protein ASE49_14680 [Novosphingobium sp. Leaf2]